MSGTSGPEEDPLLTTVDQAATETATASETVVVAVSLRTGVPLDKTVRAFVNSENHEKREEGVCFVRKVMALLVLQYTAALVIIAPCCLLTGSWFFQQFIAPYRIVLGVLAFGGIVFSIYLVATKGHEKKYAFWSLRLMTISFAFGLGIKLSMVSWANYALVALGQATTNFAMLHAVLQFDSERLRWMNWKWAGLMCFCLSCLWILVLVEAGSSWPLAAAVGLGGWGYAMNIILSIKKTVDHREPNDYVRATIFILGPPIPDFLIPKPKNWKESPSKDSPEEEKEQGGEQNNKKTTNYGAVGDSLA